MIKKHFYAHIAGCRSNGRGTTFTFGLLVTLWTLVVFTAVPASAQSLPNCHDPRHDLELTYKNTSKSPDVAPLCVCAANASGCPAITEQACQAKPKNPPNYNFPELITVPGQGKFCVYDYRWNDNPPAYWAQRIIASTQALPNCADSRHDLELTYKNEILCVCAANASGCHAVSQAACLAQTSNNPNLPVVISTPSNGKLCVYSYGQTNHPAWQNDTHPHAYWAERITQTTTKTSCLNRDKPGGVGDFETIPEFVRAGKLPRSCASPVSATCYYAPGPPDGAQIAAGTPGYICDTTRGGICTNSNRVHCKDTCVVFECND